MTDHDDNPPPASPPDPVAADPVAADPVAADPVAAAPVAAAPVAVAAPPKQRLRDRVFGFRSMLAVALAGLVLGAGAGAGVAAIAGHDDRPDFGRFEMRGPGGDRGFPGPGGFGNGENRQAPGQNGQVIPPGTQPQQQEDSSGGTSEAPSTS